MIFRIIIFIFLTTVIFASKNYYEILGVPKTATDLDIKKAYKKLAKEWHPDKNKHKDAQETFMKISEAYEVLSNAQKRQEYDAFGSVSNENMHARDTNHFTMFDNSFFGFHETFSTGNFETVTYRTFMMNILPASRHEPVLLLVVSQMCFFCGRALRFWRNVNDALGQIGVRITVADIMRDGRLQEQIKIHSVPRIVLIIDEEVKYYQGDLNLDELAAFVRGNFPRSLVTYIKSRRQLDNFHDGWMHDSRSRMVLLKPLDKPSVRYLCAAFKNRYKVAAGFINVESDNEDIEFIRKQYDAKMDQETVLVFHAEKLDISQLPAVHVKIKTPKLSLTQLNELLATNHNSRLPLSRLTSQTVLDELCPSPSRESRLKHSFCILLVLDSSLYAQNLTSSQLFTHLYSLAKLYPDITFVFVYANSQLPFLNSLNLMSNFKPAEFYDRIILMWRFDYKSAFTTFLKDTFNIDWVLKNHHTIKDNPSELPESVGTLPIQSMVLEPLFDELEDPLWLRVIYRLIYYAWWCFEFVKELLEDPWTIALTGLTILFTYYLYQGIATRIREAVKMEKAEFTEREQNENFVKYTIGQRIEKFTLSKELYKTLMISKTPGRMQAILLCSMSTPHVIHEQFLNSIEKLNSRSVEPLILFLDKHPKWISAVLSNIKLSPTSNGSGDNINSLANVLKRVSVNSPYACEGNIIVTNFWRHYFLICPINLLQQYHKFYKMNSAYSPMLDGSERIPDVEVQLHDWLSQLLDGVFTKFRVQQWPQYLY